MTVEVIPKVLAVSLNSTRYPPWYKMVCFHSAEHLPQHLLKYSTDVFQAYK